MAAYHTELLEAAQTLIARESRQVGRLPVARTRRSISTCYYAVFHFLIEDASRRIVRNSSKHLRRRRVLARSFTHAGMKLTLKKIKGSKVDRSLEDFLRPPGFRAEAVPTPAFAQEMAATFIDAQAKRHDADYDLNVPLNETDARAFHKRCGDAIKGWQKAMKADERDFKDALAIVMLLKGQVRKDE